MADSQESGPPFQVDWSGVLAARLRQLQRQASRAGNGDDFLAAFKEIVRRLQTDPTEAGEPMYRLPSLRMAVRCIAIRPLVVDYAVCEDHSLVIIKGAKLLTSE